MKNVNDYEFVRELIDFIITPQGLIISMAIFTVLFWAIVFFALILNIKTDNKD